MKDSGLSVRGGIALLLVWVLLLGANGPGPCQTLDWSKKALQTERSRSYDALHYRIVLRLDLDRKTFEGETTVSFSALLDDLETIVLDAEEFRVSKVLADWGESLHFEQTSTELRVHLREPLRRGETRSFTCFYSGTDPKVGLKFVEASARNPQIAFSDSFPNHVHHWFPCFDYPSDKATGELIATVKSGLKVVSNGRLISVIENEAAGTATYHWSQDKPHSTYLVFFAVGPYVVVRDTYKTLPVNYWVYPQDVDKAGPTYGKTPHIMAFFEKLFGVDYPWQKYDQISVVSGGGAESTSATAMTHNIMVDSKHEAEFSAEWIVAHELAHHWWGDLVTLRSWAHTWINESFATYSEYLYSAAENGSDEGDLNLLQKLNQYLREAKTRYIRPIVTERYDQPGDMFDGHTYPKGARVLHMLRNLLGDEAFFATLRHFLAEHAFRPVDTNDFINSVKEVTGQNLAWFFDQWLYKPGHPVFEVRSEWLADRKVVRMQVSQAQDFAQGVPVHHMPVTIGLYFPQGRVSKQVWIRAKEESFEFAAESKPDFVRFDVGNVLLKELNHPRDEDELRAQLKADDAVGRMEAAALLSGLKDSDEALRAVVDSALSDPFWAVRRTSIEALRRFPGGRTLAPLQRACLDSNSFVRAAALAALGDRRDRELGSFFRERFEKDESDLAKAEALRALGKTGDAGHIPFLKEIAAAPSFRNLLGNAAQQALNLLGSANVKGAKSGATEDLGSRASLSTSRSVSVSELGVWGSR
ncbi:MAG: aminopeptidase [Armatimonadetes bacterium]|nr:aminopeptidase [Armatimonadota bacterium]NOG39466.1 aminopeptidase [Armatimonadota bacterium]GIK31322.1 MAG: hypothetical protein BroJett009_03140 [Armatimonadota bacterium]